MRSNYKSPHFWREEDLANLAAKHRRSALSALPPDFSVVTFFQHDLERLLNRGPVQLVLSDLADSPDFPDCVKFKPLRLVFDSEVWEHASMGDAESRYVVAHEFGHLFLHSGHEQQFSDPKNVFRSWYMDEESTEWQAHAYARYFLLPDYIVREFHDPYELARACDVWNSQNVASAKLSRPSFPAKRAPGVATSP
jgi:IrrE N-terminal-like domain